MPDAAFTLTWFGDRCLRVSFAQAGSKEASLRMVHAAWRRLSDPEARPPNLHGLAPAFETLLLAFDPATLDHPAAEQAVRTLLGNLSATRSPASGRTVEIPVCYDAAVAPDLADVAKINGLAAVQVAELHASAVYTVAFLGFSPGFPYLVGLPRQLHTPRLATPRTRVVAGSVGIAGDQTGIYPQSTAGGWRIIGRTPLRLFDAHSHAPSLLTPGDRVRFVPITLAELLTRSAAPPEAK